jgi:hypothetical protein
MNPEEILPVLEQEVKAAAAGAGDLHSVIVYGSVVRGDFWPGQSDIDLLVVGRGSGAPTFRGVFLGPGSGLGSIKVDAWHIHQALLTSQSKLDFASRYVQFGINGFDTIDHHRVLWGEDALADMKVARSFEELQPVIRRRLCDLIGDLDRFRDEPAKFACEALKVSQLFFADRDGRLAPTRHKDKAHQRFQRYVPEFAGKTFAEEIWSLYRRNALAPDPAQESIDAFRGRCRQFIMALQELIDEAS